MLNIKLMPLPLPHSRLCVFLPHSMLELIYFSGKSCSVCQALKPKLLTAVRKHFPAVSWQVVEVGEEPARAGQAMVFTVPVVILKREGQEIFRWARSFSVQQVLHKLQQLHNQMKQ